MHSREDSTETLFRKFDVMLKSVVKFSALFVFGGASGLRFTRNTRAELKKISEAARAENRNADEKGHTDRPAETFEEFQARHQGGKVGCGCVIL